MTDEFPIQKSDVDFQIQELISQDLENARRLSAVFNPLKPYSDAELYPRSTKQITKAWLTPLLRRLRWHTSQGGELLGARTGVMSMVNELIRKIRPVTVEQFVALAEHADCFAGSPAAYFFPRMLHFAKSFEKSGSLDGHAAAALSTVLEEAHRIWKGSPFWQQFVWPCFRSTALVVLDGDTWDAVVRRDIGKMKPQRRQQWLRVFDGKARHFGGAGGACEPTRPASAALKALGAKHVKAVLCRWIGLLQDIPEPRLSPYGVVVFQYVLALLRRVEGPVLDDLLYTVACARWHRAEDAGWVETFLWVLGERRKDRTLACLQALVNNPITATHDVNEEYKGALKALEAEASGIGIDGYRWDTEPVLQSHQRRLEEMLQLAAVAVARQSYIHPLVLARMGADNMTEAERARAMKEHMAQPNNDRPYNPGPDVGASLAAINNRILKDFAFDSLFSACTNRWKWIRAHQKDYRANLVRAWEYCFFRFACQSGFGKEWGRFLRTGLPHEAVETIQITPDRSGTQTFLERYQAGDHVAVWNELVALGKSVRQEAYYADAVAVAAETMRRARYNVERLIRRLAEMGYRFVEPSDERELEEWRQELKERSTVAASAAGALSNVAGRKMKLTKRAEAEARHRAEFERHAMEKVTEFEAKVDTGLKKPPFENPDVFDPPGRQTKKHLSGLEEAIGGPLPISLRVWYEQVGAVSLMGSHEVLNPKGRKIADPLVVYGLGTDEMSRDEFEDVADDENKMEHYIAPNDRSKVGRLSGYYCIRIPNAAADAPFDNEWRQTNFVNYLRKAFEWGGFPGWERDKNPPREYIARLTEGLLPL